MQTLLNGTNNITRKLISLIGCSMLIVTASHAQHSSGRSAPQDFDRIITSTANVEAGTAEAFVFGPGNCDDNYAGPPLSIAFSSNRDGNDEIYAMNPDGGGQVNLTEDAASDLAPDISPNGRLIAFASNRMTAENPEGDYEIFIMTFDGSVVWQVTTNTGLDGWPRWSPDGETVAFETRETLAATSWEIYSYTLGAVGPVRLTTNSVLDRYPEWSPDGEVLVIRRANDLYLIASGDGSDVAQLTYDVPPTGSGFPAATGIDQMASFSPNGKYLTWMSARNGYPSVFVMNIGEPEVHTELTPRPSPAPSVFVSRAPGWSRNGQYIYFTRATPDTSNEEDIFVMNADGTCVRRLTETLGRNMEAAVR